MITVTKILGSASEAILSARLHELEHLGRVEHLVIDRDDSLRRRLRGKTDKGTDVAVALDSNQRLADGSVLLLEDSRAIVVRMNVEQWLTVYPLDMDAALEAGYCAGNHHWRVRFEPGAIFVAMQGRPAEHYAARLEHLIAPGRLKVKVDE